MLHSSYRDIHNGRVFIIYFDGYENGFTARLEVDGQPPKKYSDKIWAVREDAKVEVCNDARRMIDGLALLINHPHINSKLDAD